jgi:predicted nucleic-acid-binding Zn-ribbon protein
MEKGVSFGSVMGHPVGGTTLVKKGDVVGDKIIPFYCKNCGYIELFVEKFLKSP